MRRLARAFTLVEILIVVIILAILAAIVVPQWTNVTSQARGATLLDNIQNVRAQIQVYRNEHVNYPGGANFADQMTLPTDFSGNTAALRDATHWYGPYLQQMPLNTISSLRTVRWTADPAELFAAPAAPGGWWYNQATGEFRADLPDIAVEDSGKPFNQY
jgi:prepilin-type N-terminal cleavage/methylation domain-containing protein